MTILEQVDLAIYFALDRFLFTADAATQRYSAK